MRNEVNILTLDYNEEEEEEMIIIIEEPEVRVKRKYPKHHRTIKRRTLNYVPVVSILRLGLYFIFSCDEQLKK